ncbi:MAG TPA: hypothetical protein VIF14_17485 [Alphaproteobacteria bacterium]|jgi:hypothetical protein
MSLPPGPPPQRAIKQTLAFIGFPWLSLAFLGFSARLTLAFLGFRRPATLAFIGFLRP